MKKQAQITAFYIEAVLLILAFIGVILVLTRAFALGKSQSYEAASLTDAVCLAENAAEAVAASRSPEELILLLDEGGNVSRPDNGALCVAAYDEQLRPEAGGVYRVALSWKSEGGLVRSHIRVEREGRPVYELDTAVYVGEVAA